ncbi:scavenger mRNA-decapping enzyme DcpS [Rhodotorula toruloides]|uniref:m7GpppX diphosphatase n=1 Tax=Rhodotorula toruloides TaxID=5286 RepID=A0A511KEM1_RHOTO|nr:scavenger mRNA-decapping enzyme DcpS [Rhodotorula toruloides]
MAPAASSSAPAFSSAEALLSSFQFERVLSEDPRALLVYLLGSAVPEGQSERSSCILKLEKTPYAPDEAPSLATPGAWSKLETVTCNDIYSTSLAWFAPGRATADVQISSICPATEKHVKKYSTQVSRLVRETPQLYETVVKPYTDSLSLSTISWVYNILDGAAEAENVLYRDEDPETGFVLTPDLKWDQKTMSALYLLVLTQDRTIRSLRDLRARHIPLLRKIRSECERVAMERYGIEKGELRFFVHYQPTYYHFHVHIVHLSYLAFSGITVGQAHLLDDLIDALELEVDASHSGGPAPIQSWFERRTFTYSLGVEHPLYALLKEKRA